MGRWKDDGWTGGHMDGWKNGRMNEGQMDVGADMDDGSGYMDGWTDGMWASQSPSSTGFSSHLRRTE